MGNYKSDELSYWSILPNDRPNRKCNLRIFAINGQLVYFPFPKVLSFLAFFDHFQHLSVIFGILIESVNLRSPLIRLLFILEQN